MDDKTERVLSEIRKIEEELDKKGYHISFGVASQSKSEGSINMVELVKEAEDNMFSVKKDFYSRPENARNSR